MSPGRLWIKQGMHVQLPDQRGQSITMIGALSIHQGLIHTEAFAGSNTVDTFLPFIMRLKEKCKARPTIVVMDNLGSHKRPGIRASIEAAGASLLYLPPYSPDPSPIDMVFAMLTADLWQAISSTFALFSPEECSYYSVAAG